MPVMLSRALRAETLKLKRTIAWKMVAIAPLAVVSLTVFMVSQAPFGTLHRRPGNDDWAQFARVNLQFWALLMMPLYITLQTALIAGLDHSNNQWKSLFTRPVPRWTVYLSKLMLVLAMLFASGCILLVGIAAAGRAMYYVSPELRFGTPVPVIPLMRQAGQMTGLAFVAVAIQLWVSLRWKSFPVATGFGIVATVTALAMLLTAGADGGWPRYFPWALPMLVLAKQSANIGFVLWVTAAFTIAISIAGCIDLSRREVT